MTKNQNFQVSNDGRRYRKHRYLISNFSAGRKIVPSTEIHQAIFRNLYTNPQIHPILLLIPKILHKTQTARQENRFSALLHEYVVPE